MLKNGRGLLALAVILCLVLTTVGPVGAFAPFTKKHYLDEFEMEGGASGPDVTLSIKEVGGTVIGGALIEVWDDVAYEPQGATFSNPTTGVSKLWNCTASTDYTIIVKKQGYFSKRVKIASGSADSTHDIILTPNYVKENNYGFSDVWVNYFFLVVFLVVVITAVMLAVGRWKMKTSGRRRY